MTNTTDTRPMTITHMSAWGEGDYSDVSVTFRARTGLLVNLSVWAGRVTMVTFGAKNRSRVFSYANRAEAAAAAFDILTTAAARG